MVQNSRQDAKFLTMMRNSRKDAKDLENDAKFLKSKPKKPAMIQQLQK